MPLVHVGVRNRVLIGVGTWIVFLIILIPATIPLTLLFVYRWIVTVFMRKLFRPDLISPLVSIDCLFAADLWREDPKAVIVTVLLVERKFELESFISRVNNVILCDQYNYRRLSSVHPTYWMGYPFWTPVTNEFDAWNHVNIARVGSIDLEGERIATILKELTRMPFVKGNALWDLLVVSEESQLRTLLAFRIHHSIGDGYSILYFLKKLFDEVEESTDVEFRKPRKTAAIGTAKMLFWMPVVALNLSWNLFFRRDNFGQNKRTHEICIVRKTLPVSVLKDIRRKISLECGEILTMATPLVFALGTAIRRAFLTNVWSNVPDESRIIDTMVLMAKPRNSQHPKAEFCNHWNNVFCQMPLRESYSEQRLTKMVEDATFMAESRADEVNIQLCNILTILPIALIRIGEKFAQGTPILFANLPGPSYAVHLFGQKVLNMEMFCGLDYTHTAFKVCCLSYNNQMTLCLVANNQILSDTAGKTLLQYFQEEVEILETAPKQTIENPLSTL